MELLPALLQRLRRRHPVCAVAAVVRSDVETAVAGAAAESDFEIGSVSKGVTGLLYMDAVARGEVAPTSTLGDLLPLGDVPAASATLAALATHRSGLPRLPASARPIQRSWALWRRGTNPYGDSLDDLLGQARGVRLGRPEPRYSNFGFELLGHALAAGAGMGYAELVERRLAAPLGMRGTYVPASPDDLRRSALTGRSRAGRRRDPWTGQALGPAGGIRAPIGDMALLVRALLDGSAPGVSALDPVAELSKGAQIGAAWITLDLKGRPITWHNGGTGGFRSWVGLDRTAGIGIAILTATTRSPDGLGFRALADYRSRAGDG